MHADPKRLIDLAEEIGFALNMEEAKLYGDAMERLENELASLVREEEDRPPVRQGPRDPGHRPPRDEDPYNCFITRCFVKGAEQGPLRGRRVGLKDSISLAGVPLTLGSRFMDGFVPDTDATVVTRLLDAGADIVGKLNMDDFALATAGFGLGVGGYGRVLNPYAPEHLSGGSSSGSAAAVASGAVDLALGGDQGGSIRIPAAWCGVVGLKPTHGLVPHTGVVGVEPSIDYVGPMGRTVRDVALMLECIAGPDGYDSRQTQAPRSGLYLEEMTKGISELRIGILREGFGDDRAEPDVESAVLEAIDALKEAGATTQDISVPEHLKFGKLSAAFGMIGRYLFFHLCGGAFLEGFYDTHFTGAIGEFLKTRADQLHSRVKLCLLLGAHLEHKALVYYGRAQNVRRTYRKAYDEAFRRVDCLIMPTVPIKAPRSTSSKNEDESLRQGLGYRVAGLEGRNTVAFNSTGHPALSIPCALSQGLPVGMMLVGPHFSDGLLLRIAHSFSQSVDWDALVSPPQRDSVVP